MIKPWLFFIFDMYPYLTNVLAKILFYFRNTGPPTQKVAQNRQKIKLGFGQFYLLLSCKIYHIFLIWKKN